MGSKGSWLKAVKTAYRKESSGVKVWIYTINASWINPYLLPDLTATKVPLHTNR